MRVSAIGWLSGAVALSALVLMVVMTSQRTEAYVTSFPQEPDIDGILLTVGLTVAQWLAGLIPYPGLSALLDALINAWTPKPEDDYWENIEAQVHQVCGEFVNQDNIDKVLVYKDDLISMLQIYERSPVVGDGSYPDKNVQADAITTSIISNRFLVEASLMPWSMTLYFVDIASMHILILKDVAESYSFPGEEPSLWWKDLSTELAHYTAYARQLREETVQFRKDNIECYFDEGNKLDEYTITDHVTGEQETCVQSHPDEGEVGACSTACQNFESQMVRSLDRWYMDFVGSPAQEWDALRLLAEEMADMASPYRVPSTTRT